MCTVDSGIEKVQNRINLVVRMCKDVSSIIIMSN